MKYDVLDSYGNFLRRFSSYRDALTWKSCVMGRHDWSIKEVHTLPSPPNTIYVRY